jgi:hypothetical protein
LAQRRTADRTASLWTSEHRSNSSRPQPPLPVEAERSILGLQHGAASFEVLPSVGFLSTPSDADARGPLPESLRSLETGNVSDLEQTLKFFRNKIIWFHLDAPSSHAGARKPRGFDTRIGSRNKSQAKFQSAARRESFGGFHEESISADGYTGPAGHAELGPDPRPERQYRPDQH